MGVLVMTNVSSAILVLMNCRPIQKTWTPNLPGTCWSQEIQNSLGLYNGGEGICCHHHMVHADRKSVTAILSDFTLAILPTFYLWNLQIGSQVKIGICCLMGFGILQVPH